MQIEEDIGLSSEFQVVEILLMVTNDNTVYSTDYGLITSNGELGTFTSDVDISTPSDPQLKLYFTAYNATNTTTTSAETIDQWSATLYRSAKYQMQVENYLGFLALDIMLLHDGSTTNLVQSSVTTLLGNTGAFSSDISGGMVRLRVTANDPTTALTYYRRSLVSLRGNESLPTDLMTGSSGYDLMEVISINPSDLMNP